MIDFTETKKLMKNSKGIKSALAMLVMLLFVVGCAATNTASNGVAGKRGKKVKAYDPTGTWEYTVDSPDGSTGGTLIIEGNPGTYTASLGTEQFGTLEVLDVDLQGTSMTGNIEVMGTSASLECDFDGDTMSGAVYFGEDTFPLEGNRVSK